MKSRNRTSKSPGKKPTTLAARKRVELLSGKVSRGDATRRAILDAAVKLFAKHGFDQVSLKMIGDIVGISQAAVAQHYGNRRNIILKVRQVVTQSNRLFVDSRIAVEDDNIEQLVQHLYQNYQWASEHPEQWQIILLTYYFAISDKDFSSIHAEGVKSGAERVERYIAWHLRVEKIHLEAQQRFVLAEELHAYLIGFACRELSKPKGLRISESSCLEHFRSIVQRIFGAAIRS